MNLASIPIFRMSRWDRDRREQREMQQYVKDNRLISFHLAADDWLIQCPYNNGHFILEERFARHQIKCRHDYLKKCHQKNTEPQVAICQWNGHHHIPKSDLEEHEARCPDMAETVDRLAYFSRLGQDKERKEREMKEKEASGDTAFQDVNVNATVNGAAADGRPGASGNEDNPEIEEPKEEEESWDEELKRSPAQTYDPEAKLKQNRGRMIQDAPGITTKSERKKFRAEQNEIFENKYKGDTSVLDNLGEVPLEHEDFGLPEIDTHQRRAALELQKLQQAQKNAALSADHHSLESRKRRSVYASDQIVAIMEQARAEAEGTTSDATSNSDTISNVTGSTMSLV